LFSYLFYFYFSLFPPSYHSLFFPSLHSAVLHRISFVVLCLCFSTFLHFFRSFYIYLFIIPAFLPSSPVLYRTIICCFGSEITSVEMFLVGLLGRGIGPTEASTYKRQHNTEVRGHTTMPGEGFETTISLFHSTLDHATTGTDRPILLSFLVFPSFHLLSLSFLHSMCFLS
jgi:hypothetical protein